MYTSQRSFPYRTAFLFEKSSYIVRNNTLRHNSVAGQPLRAFSQTTEEPERHRRTPAMKQHRMMTSYDGDMLCVQPLRAKHEEYRTKGTVY